MKKMHYYMMSVLAAACLLGCSDDSRYEALLAKYKTLAESSTNSVQLASANATAYFAAPKGGKEFIWHDENGHMLVDVTIGNIKYKHFGNDLLIPKVILPRKLIEPGSGIYLSSFDHPASPEYDGEYVSFIYNGVKYFIAYSWTTKFTAQICGFKFPCDEPDDSMALYLSHMLVRDQSRFWFRRFLSRPTYVSGWDLGDGECMKVSRNHCNQPVITFFTSPAGK